MTSYAGETAIALLIEASAPIVNAWSTIASLVPPILARAVQCKPANRVRVGVILYGPSHNPLLLNLFFTAPQLMHEVLKQAYESGPLGKRRPAVTGKDPVAVLDALVAALEMFDTLTSVPIQKPVWKQVLHMAAVEPDDARHSTTCVRPELDGMGWEGLVQAFKEREINYSSVRYGKRPLGALGEFQKKLATDTIKPWLSYDAALTLHISASFTAPARPHPIRRPGVAAEAECDEHIIAIKFCTRFIVGAQLLRCAQFVRDVRDAPTTTVLDAVQSAGVDDCAIVCRTVECCAESDAGGDDFGDAIECECESTEYQPLVDADAVERDADAVKCDTDAFECDADARIYPVAL
ncbi:uncharacterized protein SCHCODRAFT_02667815 [Schizophyllum commune H4-8]|nr:uncharacterized protein SCHCODRAFT_02667815 [Schizophyllum commune H4-8]KAI5892349.1 hypothetical protein SCHCODRAFT_02667815 [Schizophyllum commune H4-8]